MIVVCSTCQARFKVADDKIGPRGAKVRCSKCQTVFVVHKELGVMPAEGQQPPAAPPPAQPAPGGGFDLDLEGAPGSGVRPSGLVADPFGRPAPPPAADPFAAAGPSASAPDPFGSADPFQAQPAPARAPEQPGHDPFGGADPFAAASGGSFGAVDPFVATVASPAPGLPTSAVTDLSDLLGSAPTPPSPPPPPPAPRAPEPSGILDSGFDFDAGQEGEPSLETASAPPPPSSPMGYGEADLALDERTPAPAASAPMPGLGDFAGADPFGEPIGPPSPAPQPGNAGAEGGDFDAFGAEPEPAPPPARHAAPPVPPREHAFGAEAALAAAPAPAAEESEPAVAPTSGFRRTSRARTVAVNAISLVALLAVAVGMLAIWRGVRPGSGGLFRAAEASRSEAEPFSASELRSAIYERPDAPPLVFVTGNAVSRAAAPVAALRVHVELVRRGVILAQGEGRAGALPTPEDLAAARDAAGLSAALERSAARAPSSVKPGQSVPFLVAIADFPGDVAGAGLRVTFEPVAAAPDAPPAPPPDPPAPAVPPEGAKAP